MANLTVVALLVDNVGKAFSHLLTDVYSINTTNRMFMKIALSD